MRYLPKIASVVYTGSLFTEITLFNKNSGFYILMVSEVYNTYALLCNYYYSQPITNYTISVTTISVNRGVTMGLCLLNPRPPFPSQTKRLMNRVHLNRLLQLISYSAKQHHWFTLNIIAN